MAHTTAIMPSRSSSQESFLQQAYSEDSDPFHTRFDDMAMSLNLMRSTMPPQNPYNPRSSQGLPTTLGGQGPYAAWAPVSAGLSPPIFSEDHEMAMARNMSPASGPSAPSSSNNSPQIANVQPASIPDWSHQGMMSPGIVGAHDFYHAGSEYTTLASNVDEMHSFPYHDAPKPGFVGEFSQTLSSSSSAPQQQQQPLDSTVSSVSRRNPSCSVPSESSSNLAARSEDVVSPQSASAEPSLFASPTPSASVLSPSAASWASPTSQLSPFFSQRSGHFIAPLGSSYPSLIQPEINRPITFDNTFVPPAPGYATSPPLTSTPSPPMKQASVSPFLSNVGFQYSSYPGTMDPIRRSSMGAYNSDSDTKEKQRCPHADCGKKFKDLKAHMLTHQNERPEKCPIPTCEYHTKGFARKYDKNRHTLTHYKGTMVCGFCPRSGSNLEKSFNRADVFKRHLTTCHQVEQTPPNSRKNKNGAGAASSGIGKKPGGDCAADATGKCSTCSLTFSNAQDFYEHLDECVLRVVQLEDPAEAINAKRLAEVEDDPEVHSTLQKNNLPTSMQTMSLAKEDEDEGMDDDENDKMDQHLLLTAGLRVPVKKSKGNPPAGVQKSRGMTHSRGGVPLSRGNQGKVRKNNKCEFPPSWGYDEGQMKFKKRIMTAFDGPRRLAKDDMMLSTEHEVRMPLADGKSYVTDLDVQTLKRAEGFLSATDSEKGLWLSDDPTAEDFAAMWTGQ